MSAEALTFGPAVVTIRAGGAVTWVWGARQFHNVTIDGFAPSATTDTGPFSQTFGSPGTYGYRCDIHPATMTGTVVVQ